MAAKEVTPVETEPKPKMCNSRACRAISSVTAFLCGYWIFDGVCKDTGGIAWKRGKPWNQFRMAVGIYMMAWGLVNAFKLPRNG